MSAADRPAPRIPPLTKDEWNAAIAGRMATDVGLMTDTDNQPLNIFATLARHTDLFQAWIDFGAMLLIGGELPARERELGILRVGWLCRAPYEWGQHVQLGLAVGLTQEEIDRIPVGADAPGWSDVERLVLRATDELHDGARITEETWAHLAEHFDERQLIELPVLIGQYHLVCFALNSLGVQPEAELPGLPDAPG